MQNKKLSIIIPHYNSADLLDKLLSTIPNEETIQVVVVDDHSDKLVEELEECKKKYNDSNVEFYVNESRIKGAGGARNTGLKYAKGEWLMFADADDFFLADFYEIIEPFFDEEYDIVYLRSTSIDLATGEITDRHVYIDSLIKGYLDNPTKKNYLRLKYNYVSPCAKLVRKELLEKYEIKFDEVIVANDVMCSIKIACHTDRIYVSDKVIYCITKQPGTLTTTITEERYDARMEVYYRRHQYIKEHLPRAEYKMLRFDARVRLRQAKEFGTKKYFVVLREILLNRVPIWREFSASYYYDVIGYMLKDLKAQYMK